MLDSAALQKHLRTALCPQLLHSVIYSFWKQKETEYITHQGSEI